MSMCEQQSCPHCGAPCDRDEGCNGVAVAAVANGVAAIWHPWHLVLAVVFLGCGLAWRRVNQRVAPRGADTGAAP